MVPLPDENYDMTLLRRCMMVNGVFQDRREARDWYQSAGIQIMGYTVLTLWSNSVMANITKK